MTGNGIPDKALVSKLLSALRSAMRPCPQCGQHITDDACGPTHAIRNYEIEALLVKYPSGDDATNHEVVR